MTKAELLEMIPVGFENRISQEKLAANLGVDSRTIRALVSKARQQGAVIISLPDAGGYFQPSPEETKHVKHYVAAMKQRKRSAEAAAFSAMVWLDEVNQHEYYDYLFGSM